ncbi:hypothetical protein BKA80DRAFT_264952 [Phyllosticta citrichinensis]
MLGSLALTLWRPILASQSWSPSLSLAWFSCHQSPLGPNVGARQSWCDRWPGRAARFLTPCFQIPTPPANPGNESLPSVTLRVQSCLTRLSALSCLARVWLSC